MGLFSFLFPNRKNQNDGTSNQFSGSNPGNQSHDIPEDKFIAKGPQVEPLDPSIKPDERIDNIAVLFDFLDENHETKGYEDALVNPDSHHMDQNIISLKNRLERTLAKVKTFYTDFIKEIDYHIESRARRGMIDTVDELKTKREIASGHLDRILQIESDAKNNAGSGQGILISYERGFKNGLAAISHFSILKRKL